MRSSILRVGWSVGLAVTVAISLTVACGTNSPGGAKRSAGANGRNNSLEPRKGTVDDDNPGGTPEVSFGEPDSELNLGSASPSSTAPTGRGCTGLQCKQVTCPPETPTTVSGRVFDPSGKVPLYNVIVYVPNGAVQPLPSGVSCDKCAASIKDAVASAITDAEGRFVLKNVPVVDDLPVVLQVGKWRRQLRVRGTKACANTTVDETESHLPRDRTEGDIPQIAVTTGSADSMECFFRKIGIRASEYSRPDEEGRIHLYQGKSPSTAASISGGTPPATALWDNLDALKKHDVVILSCEGNEYLDSKSPEARQNMLDYLNSGGRVFASHFHYVWFKQGPAPLPQTATWTTSISESSGAETFRIDTSFPKGAAFADWLVHVGASKRRGEIELRETRSNVKEVNPQVSRQWIYRSETFRKSTNYFSFNTPIGLPADQQCGQAVFTDLHVSGKSDGRIVPRDCKDEELSAQEKALLFLLLDLSACVQDPVAPPAPPPPVPPPIR